MPDVKLVESGFRGLDESKASETLPEGFLTRADHVILDHGEVRLRPGMVSQLSSVLPTAAYVLGSATDGTGNYLLIAANGKIRRWDWSANATS